MGKKTIKQLLKDRASKALSFIVYITTFYLQFNKFKSSVNFHVIA